MLRLNRTALVSLVAIGVPLGALLWLERRTLVARLRHKLESQLERPRHILTVHGVGYRFVD